MSVKVSKKRQPIKKEEIEPLDEPIEEIEEEDEIIEKPKPVMEKPIKEKKPRTEKQQQQFLNALEIKRRCLL